MVRHFLPPLLLLLDPFGRVRPFSGRLALPGGRGCPRLRGLDLRAHRPPPAEEEATLAPGEAPKLGFPSSMDAFFAALG